MAMSGEEQREIICGKLARRWKTTTGSDRERKFKLDFIDVGKQVPLQILGC